MYELMRELFPICRSLTGEGVRETLRVLERDVPLEWTEIPSGTQVFDWTIPKEWSIRDAWIADDDGRRIVDFNASNLHVLGYSVPQRGRFTFEELGPHLHTHPESPDWIPFRTSYHDPNWGFCLSQHQLRELEGGTFDVCIDSSLEDGSLTYAESTVEGGPDEVLISTYVCHPSLANDNLSGIALVAALAKHLRRQRLRHTYRFLLGPGTLGPLAWLWNNQAGLGRIRHGLAVSCVGDPGPPTYKKSRDGDAEIDRAVLHVLAASGREFKVEDFVPWGGDERQFSAPAFDLPIGCLSRTPQGSYPEYHSSADDLDFVAATHLGESFELYLDVIDVLEGNGHYENLNPQGEPQLGRRGLYGAISTGAPSEAEVAQRALLWVLNLSDGDRSLLDVAIRSGLPFRAIRRAADQLVAADLLREVDS